MWAQEIQWQGQIIFFKNVEFSVLTYLAYRQFWDPLLISETVKVSNFKFSTKLEFDE